MLYKNSLKGRYREEENNINSIFKCLHCGEYMDDNSNGCLSCGYPSDYVVHVSRLISKEVEEELYRETEIMIGMDHSEITLDGINGDIDNIKNILGITKYQAEMLRGWVYGISQSDI